MARTLFGGAGETPVTFASATRFVFLLGDRFTGVSATEAQRQFRWRGAGTINRFGMWIISNGRGTDTSFFLRINGANTALTFTVPGGGTGYFEDAVNEVAIADGDLVSLGITSGSGAGSLVFDQHVMQFEADTGTSVMYGCYANTALTGAVTRYTGFTGKGGTATEAVVSGPAGADGTFSRLGVYVVSNSLASATTTLRFRKNGVNGAQVVTIAAGATGLFEDVTNSDAVDAADLIGISIATVGGGGGSITIGLVTTRFVSSDGPFQIGTVMVDGNFPSSTVSSYFLCFGGQGAGRASEAETQVDLPFRYVARGLSTRLSGNGSSVPVTVTVRKNGADTAIQATAPIATNGVFTDTADAVEFLSGDLIDFRVSPTTGDATVTVDWILLTLDSTPARTRRTGVVMMRMEGVG